MLQRFASSPFLKNFLVVLQGSVLAQLVGFLILPVLSRLYSPSAFGVYQSGMSMLTMALAAASLRYEIPILLAPAGMMLRSLVRLNVLLNVLTALVVIMACLAATLLFPTKSASFLPILYIAPLWFFSASLSQTFSYVALRNQAFQWTAFARVGQAGAFAAAGIIGGILWAAPIGLVLADVCGRLVSGAIFFFHGGTLARGQAVWSNYARMRIVAARYRDFPRLSLLSAIVNTGGGVITPLLMLVSFDTATIGQYVLVDRCLGAVVAVIGQALSQVFMTDLAKALRSNTDAPSSIFRRIVKVQFLIGVLPAIIGIVLLPSLFPMLFGQKWQIAGIYGAILVPFYLVSFIVVPVNMALTIMERQNWQLAWDTFRLVGVVLVWSLTAWCKWGALTGISAYTGFGILAYLLYLFITDRLLKRLAAGAARAVLEA